MIRWLRREAFRTAHLGVGRVHVVSHTWGEVIAAVALGIVVTAAVVVFAAKVVAPA